MNGVATTKTEQWAGIKDSYENRKPLRHYFENWRTLQWAGII
jgi:hypothetical protein